MRGMKRIIAGATAAGVLAAGLVGYALGSPVSAIPNPQENCAFNSLSITTADGTPAIPGLAVTVNNTTANTQRAIVQLSADLGVDDQAEVRVSYQVDGGAPQEDVFGPPIWPTISRSSKVVA